ncbi:MAG TPA: IreB family regulatory phosphoprotein [Lactovum miscens]|uniref:IreB family regulatory phosphoprotein n=1 Tax=Lactovum miscens TaxID=190387 RepID=UPI002EDB42F1
MSFNDETMRFDLRDFSQNEIQAILTSVYSTLSEKGYEPINQIVGYLLSGDPAYIPRHNEARAKMSRLNRDDIVEELVKSYLRTTGTIH